jgi:hypothetical protein
MLAARVEENKGKVEKLRAQNIGLEAYVLISARCEALKTDTRLSRNPSVIRLHRSIVIEQSDP